MAEKKKNVEKKTGSHFRKRGRRPGEEPAAMEV